jgi:hypothetical protein
MTGRQLLLRFVTPQQMKMVLLHLEKFRVIARAHAVLERNLSAATAPPDLG